MLVLIVVIIAAAFLFRQIAADTHFNNTFDAVQKEREDFCAKYAVTLNEENAVREMIDRRAPVIQELEDKLTAEIGMKPQKHMLLWGYLAKSGKIPCRDTSCCSYNLNRWNVLIDAYDGAYANVKSEMNTSISRYDALDEIQAARLKFLKWYNKEMKAHGMEYELMCVKTGSDGKRHIADAKRIEDCQNLRDVAAFWMPARSCVPFVTGLY